MCVIDKMVVHQKLVVEDIDKNSCVGYEAARHTRIWKVKVAHGVVV